jgi:hypothetical protein
MTTNTFDTMTPLEDFVALHLHEGWDEQHSTLEALAEAFAADVTEDERVALVAAIDAAIDHYKTAEEWPVALWPFEEDEGAPQEALSVVRAALVAAT